MAAMVPTAPHAQQNNMSAANLLPPGINRETLQQYMSKFQQLKDDGASDQDPEVIKLRNILQAAKQHSEMQRQRALHQRQLQQQQQNMQNLQNGNGQPPQTNGFANANVNSPQTAVPNGQGSPRPGQGGDAPVADEAGLSQQQMALLRNQMVAFKCLARNAPISPSLQRQIFPSQRANSSPTPAETLDAAANAIATQSSDTDQHPSAAPKHVYETFKSPYASLKKYIRYDMFEQRANRPLIPSITPIGIDADRIREERETVIYNRIMNRKAELEKLNANMVSYDASKSDMAAPDTSMKLKALLEYKKLCLLPKQRALRQQITREMVQANNLAMTANRSLYRRQKKQSTREARITERLEKAQRDARESKEKKKHSDYMRSILEHAREVQRAAEEQRSRLQRLGRMMMQQHQTIEKEEQKRVERTAKQRLQALKANDEETYLKLLGQAKDSRISHLLKQTDSFLNQLAASVKTQQRSTAQHYGDKHMPSEEPSDDEEDDEDDEEGRGKKVDYYEVAHKIKEEIKEQSSNLVGGTLKEYQIKGLQWMISLYNNNLNGILADEMGLGKTIQTISLITYLIEKKNQRGPFLVIVPLSTLTNWNNEFEKWAPSVRRVVYKGPPNARKQAASQLRFNDFQVVLTTYEFIIKDRPVLSKIKWLHMIVDEGHRMKNAESKLSQTITTYYHTRYRIILTGTPLQNNLPELWALLNFVLPNIFKSVKSFDEWFNTPFANTGGQDNMSLTEEEQILVIRRLHRVLRPFLLRRLKKDVEKDLPNKQERVIKCNFSSLQAKLYKQLVTHNKLMVSDGKGGKTGMRGLSNMLMQLRKLCNHPFVFEEVENQLNPSHLTNDMIWRTAGKFELLDRILPKFRASGHRVLMFFQMTQIMNIMEDFMLYRQIPYMRLDGSTKSDERADLLKDFNAENSPYFCFLLSTRAGGLGLNLQTADTVIIFDSDWNPHQDLQAQDRAHRIGQKNEVRILRLISSNSVEEKILERANFKLDMDGKVIQAGKFDNKSTNEEREAMLRVMLESAEAAEDLQQDEMDDEELNSLMMRSDDEYTMFQKMDQDRYADPLYGNHGKLPRLLGEEELPEIYVSEDNPEPDADIEEINFGRGARERTRVKYDDGLTEEQWLDAVDNDDDTIEAAVARKQAKIARRAANKEKKYRGDSANLADTPPPASRESSESPVPTKSNRRGRKPGARASSGVKRTADDASLDSESVTPAASSRKRGRQAKVIETLSSGERDALQTALEEVFEQMSNLEAPSIEPGDDTTRDLTVPFIDLPSRTDYADYYSIIRDPICIKMIERKINRKEYQSLNSLASDVVLMCNNCRTYNDDSSWLFKDADAIQDKTLGFIRDESSKNADALGKAAFTGVDDANGADSAGPASGFGTPVPTPGPRIKLNFNP